MYMWYHISLYVEKCLPLFLYTEIMQDVVVLADNRDLEQGYLYPRYKLGFIFIKYLEQI